MELCFCLYCIYITTSLRGFAFSFLQKRCLDKHSTTVCCKTITHSHVSERRFAIVLVLGMEVLEGKILFAFVVTPQYGFMANGYL